MSDILEPKQNTNHKIDSGLVIYFYLAVAGFLLVVAPYMLNFWSASLSKDGADWGQFGDYFGGMLNPLLAFVGLLALLKTISIQSRELALSREALRQNALELEMSRQELEGSRRALEEQSKGIDKQVFEVTFFHLFKVYQEARTKAFQHRRGNQQTMISWVVPELHLLNLEGRKLIDLHDHFDPFIEYTQSFSTLFQYLSNNDSGRDKNFYLTLIKQQLLTDEQFLLFYIGLRETDKGLPFIKSAIENYQLLSKLPEGIPAEGCYNKQRYHRSAFGM